MYSVIQWAEQETGTAVRPCELTALKSALGWNLPMNVFIAEVSEVSTDKGKSDMAGGGGPSAAGFHSIVFLQWRAAQVYPNGTFLTKRKLEVVYMLRLWKKNHDAFYKKMK